MAQDKNRFTVPVEGRCCTFSCLNPSTMCTLCSLRFFWSHDRRVFSSLLPGLVGKHLTCENLVKSCICSYLWTTDMVGGRHGLVESHEHLGNCGISGVGVTRHVEGQFSWSAMSCSTYLTADALAFWLKSHLCLQLSRLPVGHHFINHVIHVRVDAYATVYRRLFFIYFHFPFFRIFHFSICFSVSICFLSFHFFILAELHYLVGNMRPSRANASLNPKPSSDGKHCVRQSLSAETFAGVAKLDVSLWVWHRPMIFALGRASAKKLEESSMATTQRSPKTGFKKDLLSCAENRG